MSRLIFLFFSTLLIGNIYLQQAECIQLRTKLLYKQAFTDGFYRGLAGDLAVVTYKPVNKGRFVYYYQVPLYYTKYGYSRYAHGQPKPQAEYGIPETSYGIPGTSYGIPETSYGIPYSQYGVPHSQYPPISHGVQGAYAGEYGAPPHY